MIPRTILGVVVLSWLAPIARAGEAIEFNRDIRPILSENCFYCHGPDKNHRDSGLRLDIRADAVAREGFVPGKPDESELIARIVSDDPDEVMPPPKANKKLTAAQKDLLRRWIAEGAEYQPHWAYITPTRPPLPAVARRDWVRNPIDAFILGTLEAKGLQPSPEADRRTLLRRLSLDLIGLPPTPEEVRAFVADDDPRAFEKQVDRLLASPHYGERMAVPWLDLVRFADTVGYHGDQNANIFPYRDYVIDAFNRNLPFDRFTAEQLAGDLLPDPTQDQVVATGFNRLNMVTREGGAQPKEYLAKYAGDRARTVAITWLGSTMGCAECHDHKFDPFTSKDFYRLAAFFADVKQWGVYNDYDYTPNPELRGWSNDHPFPPEIEVESRYLVRRRDHLLDRMAAVVAESAKALSEPERGLAFEAWLRSSVAFLGQNPEGWTTPPASADRAEPQPDGSLLLAGPAKKGDPYRVRLEAGPGWVAAIRLEALPHEAHKGMIVRDRAAGALIQLSATVTSARTGRKSQRAFAQADADFKEEQYSNGAAILGIERGWKTSGREKHVRQASVWLLDRPIQIEAGDELVVSVKADNVGCIRLATSPFGYRDIKVTDVDASHLKEMESTPESRTPEQARQLHQMYLLGTGWDAEALKRYNALRDELRECRDGFVPTMITRAMEPLTTRVLPRGNWQDETGEVVTPGVPHFLPQPAGAEGRRLNRLDLARWLTAPENPLTARVFVNRLWKQCFGAGLSGVMEDVGAQGEPPSHPALLDWLAVEFRESGWDVKHVLRLIVTSAAYRQVSDLRPDLREIDPANRLLAAQSPRRLDAEFVRDNALAVAGLLDPETGGPSAKPYQPAGYYENLQFPDRDYAPDRDDRQYRRGVYTHWQRTFLHPMLANFDAPSREECTATRIMANSPQQALTLLNDPTFVEAARVLAGSLLASASSDEDRIDLLFRRALARPANPKEARSLRAFLDAQRSHFRGRPDDARKLLRVGLARPTADDDAAEGAAWTAVCRVVLNLHESITRY